MNRRVNFLLAIAACFLCVQTFWADDLAAVDKQDKKKEEPADKQAKQIELLQQINRLPTRANPGARQGNEKTDGRQQETCSGDRRHCQGQNRGAKKRLRISA